MEYNNNFSIEYIFRIVGMHNHAVGIQFVPATVSYRKYPDGITLTQISSPQKEILVKNVLEGNNTFGTIIGEGYDNHKTFLNSTIEEIRFTTFDVLEIEPYDN